MAQTIQIAPKWKFPHVQSYVNDYTEVTDGTVTVSPTTTSPHFIAVFTSGQGIDNTFVDVSTEAALRKIFGAREFDKYGQPYSQALATIAPARGNAIMHAMRVMPVDATYANSYVIAHYKSDVANKKFKIYWENKSYTGAEAPNSDNAYREKMETSIPDANGFKGLTLVAVRTAGRGKYGNNYRWRITVDSNYEKEYKIKMFKFELILAKNGIATVFNATGSACYTDYTQQTTYINDIIRDNLSTGDIPAVIEIAEDNFNTLYDAYVQFLQDVANTYPDEEIAVVDPSSFDPFYGLLPNNGGYNKYIEVLPQALTKEEQDALDDPSGYDANDYAPEGVKVVAFDYVQGNNLAGGSDGSLDNSDPKARQAAINKCYIDAFSGVYDKRILSALRIPAVALFDANYDYEVKKVLVELAQMRNDALLYLDCGIMPSFSDAIVDRLIEDYSIFDTTTIMNGSINVPCVSKNLHHYVIRDQETKRKHTVTFVYYLASIYYAHYVITGSYIPLAQANCQLANHVKDSLAPTVEIFENTLREKFTEHRFNWCEATGPNTFRRVCQLTAQTPESDIIEENNVQTLFMLKRNIEAECRERLYTFTSDEARADLAEYIMAQHRSWVGSRIESLSVRFTQNTWEGERSIVRGYINVAFRGLMKRIILEFDINKRDYSE